MVKTILLLCISIRSFSQIGGYIQAGPESFYKKNFTTSIGIIWKEVRVGYYYQSAQSKDGKFNRKGLYTEVGLCNIDSVLYLSAGLRILTTNSEYVEFIPHATVSFRIKKYVEIPIQFSTFNNFLTGSFGIRLLFR